MATAFGHWLAFMEIRRSLSWADSAIHRRYGQPGVKIPLEMYTWKSSKRKYFTTHSDVKLLWFCDVRAFVKSFFQAA
jgi:hypothetical protein